MTSSSLPRRYNPLSSSPQAKSKAQCVDNDYSAQLTPQCLYQREFLPPPNLMFPSQDFREGQSQKTLAYAQTLQYWVEKSNPPMPGWPCLLARCMQDLRKMMETYVAFSDDAILEGATPQEKSLEGWTQAPTPVETQEAPTEEPTEELAPAEVSTEEATPTKEPTKESAPAVASMEETAPKEEPNEEPATPMAMASGWTGEPEVPPVWPKEKEKGEVPHSSFPGWTEVLHPSQTVIPTRQAPLTLSKLRWQWCNWSVGGGGPSAKEPRNAGRPCRRNIIQCHHQSPQSPYQRLHCPQASRGLWPAAEKFTLSGSHWGFLRTKVARYINGTHSGNSVCYPNSPGQGHWGYMHGHGNHLGGESGLWEPPHGSQSPRTYCGGHYWPLLGSKGGWLPWYRATMAVLADTA